MADYTTRVVTRRIYEVAIPNPTVGAELDKAWMRARNAFLAHAKRPVQYDDDIRIRATDDEIILFFEKDEEENITS